MALELMDEHEQGELVRNWLRQNAVAILVGIVAGLGALIGWQQWEAHKRAASAEAQAEYKAFVAAMDERDDEAAQQAADVLRDKFPDSPYAAFAALRQAKAAAASGDSRTAVASLEWARAHADLEPLAELATLRLARAKIGAGDAQGAIALLDTVKDEGYAAVIAELRGDALAALGRKDEARTAYEEALTRIADPYSRERSFIEMKRDDLAVAAAPAAPAAAPAPAAPSPAASPAAEEAKS